MQDHLSAQLSEKRTQHIVWTLLCLMPMVGMAVDLIAPSLPAIADSLHVPNYFVKNAVSIYLLGYALGNFFIGFLSDAMGRQKLIRLNLLGFVIASLIPVLFPHVGFLLFARFLQGITIGAVAVLVRTIFSDILPADKLVRLGTLVGTMWGLGPVIGPILGGYLQSNFGWKAGFYFFALIALISFTVTFFIVPETHLNRQPLRLNVMKTNLTEILKNRLFMAVVILMGLAYSLILVFNTVGPFLIQSKFHYSPVFFGHVALYLGLMFLMATFICRYFLKRYKVEQLYFFVINVSFSMIIVLMIIGCFYSDSLVITIVTSILMYFICGFIFPLSMGKGLSLFKHIAGTASATMYLINILITSAVTFLVSFIDIKNFISLGLMYLVLLLGCVCVYWGMIRKAH